jgi:xanthine dehydrogenase YagS FAD-binding subunit
MTMAEFYHEAWKNPAAHNAIQARGFLSASRIPLKRTRSAYRQVSEKSEFDWALVSCAAAGNVTERQDHRRARRARRGRARALHGRGANQFLEGKPLTDETASQAADIILKDAKPLAQNGYKVPLAHALIRRTLLALNP